MPRGCAASARTKGPAEVRREAASTIAPLTCLLADPEVWIRAGAAEALALFGNEAHAAAPAAS